MKPKKFTRLQEREKGFEPSTLALASRLGPFPGGTDDLQDSPTLRHSEALKLTAESTGSQISQPMVGFSAPNVDGHVDGVPERRTRERHEASGPHERLLTVRQVAELLSVSRATVYTLVSRGVLPHLRCSNAIRVRPNDLERYCAGAHESSWR